MDISVIGIGIESSQKIEPGIIRFKEGVTGHKYGALVWCNESGGRFRAGIQFLALTREEEEYLLQRLEQGQPDDSLPDPAGIIARLIDRIRK